MSTAKKIVTNTGFILAGNVIVKILALFVAVYLARYLGVEYFGEYNFVITYLTFFIFVANFGLDPILIRNLSRNVSNTGHLISNVFILRIATSVISILLAVLLIRLLGYPVETVLYVSVLSLILLFQGMSYLFESVFNANLKMHYSAIGLIVSKFFFFLLVFILIYLEKSLIHILYAYVASEFIRTLIAFYYSHKFVIIKLSPDLLLCKSLLKECLPFIISYALFIIYYRIDIIMLSKMGGNLAVGLYSAAYRMVDPILFIPAALASTLMPLMSKEYVRDFSKLQRLYSSGSKYILLLMLPLTVFLFLLADDIVHLLYTEDFFPAAVTFQILSLTLIFNSMNTIQNSLLIASDRQKVNTLSVGMCCILNIALNAVLIPVYGYNGAAIATLISVVFLFLVQLLFIKQVLSLVALNKDIYRILLSSLMLGVIILFFSQSNVFIITVICIFFYSLFLYVTKSLSRSEISMMLSMIKKK